MARKEFFSFVAGKAWASSQDSKQAKESNRLGVSLPQSPTLRSALSFYNVVGVAFSGVLLPAQDPSLSPSESLRGGLG